MKYTKLFLLSIFIINLSACNKIGYAKFEEVASQGGSSKNNIDPAIIFAGIDSVASKTDSTIILNWTSHADAVAYDIFNTINGTAELILTVIGQASNQFQFTNLSPGVSYRFRVRVRTSQGLADNNINDVSVTMNSAPNTPTVTLQNPATQPSFIASPTYTISGIKAGDTIRLYSGAGCTNLVAAGVASGATLNLTSTALAGGSYSMSATSTNLINNISGCSAPATYTRNLCPTINGDYIPVPANANLGTPEFCVSKYEMKNSGGIARSQAAGSPWVNRTQVNAMNACSNLGTEYALISNPEWMSLARNIELVNSNWSSGGAGTGFINRGWTASNSSPHFDGYTHTASAPSTGLSCLYSSAANTCSTIVDHRFKRTHNLSNGEEIWDLSGNVWEWVDWNVTPAQKAYQLSDPIIGDQGWKNWSSIDTNIGLNDEMPTSTWASSFFPSLGGSQGLGKYYAFTNSAGGAAVRGGSWATGSNAGLFSLHLGHANTATQSYLGFRCVYRP